MTLNFWTRAVKYTLFELFPAVGVYFLCPIPKVGGKYAHAQIRHETRDNRKIYDIVTSVVTDSPRPVLLLPSMSCEIKCFVTKSA